MVDQSNDNIDEIFQDFHHPNPYINNKAYKKIASLFPMEAMPRLISYLDNDDTYLRRKSVKALAFIGDIAIDTLVDLFNSSKDRRIRSSCLKVFVLYVSKNPKIFVFDKLEEVIQQSFIDSSPEVNLIGITLLGQIGAKGIPLLMKSCTNNNILIAKAATTALAESNDPKAEKFLRNLLLDKQLDELIINSIISALNLNGQIN